MNPYHEWKAETREEYMLHPGGFHSLSPVMLQVLLDILDMMIPSEVNMFLEWAEGLPGKNWTESADDAIKYHVNEILRKHPRPKP